MQEHYQDDTGDLSTMEYMYDAGRARIYWKSIQPQLLIIVLLFALSTASGYVYSSMHPESVAQSLEDVSELVDIIGDLSPIGIMLFIFFNNAIKSLLMLVLGIGFGLLPLVFIAYNGFIIGVVCYVFSAEDGFAYVLSAILPHGIIELPMIFISAAIGLKIGQETFRAASGRPANIRDEFFRGVGFYFRWIMPLLFVAAVIETFVTPFVIRMVS